MNKIACKINPIAFGQPPLGDDIDNKIKPLFVTENKNGDDSTKKSRPPNTAIIHLSFLVYTFCFR